MTAHTADPASDLLGAAERLVEDVSMQTIRTWKELNPDGLAVGYLPIWVPRPLFEAMGCLPVAIFGGGDQIDIIRGDSYFQSYICHIPRSVIELGLAGHYDCLDAMIFPSICDVIRNLGGMWTLLFPDCYTAYLDLPQNFDRAVGGRFFASELNRIADDLAQRGACALSEQALVEAIGAENERWGAIADLDAFRREEPWRVRASEAYVAVRAGSLMPAARHTALIRDFIAAVKRRKARPFDSVRVVVRGAFCEQPPLALIRALEMAGCDIVDDDFQLGLRTIPSRIEVRGEQDPVEALAMAYINQGCETASRYIADQEKGASLVQIVRDAGADGVIFAAASFCDPALLDQPMLERVLERERIPFTSFKFSENTGQFHVIREQAGAFSDAVKLWGPEE